MNVIDIDSYRSSLTITDFDGNLHVIPVKFFLDVASRRIDIKELDEHEKIIPVLVFEWLAGLEVTE